jgi:hypothetical protein
MEFARVKVAPQIPALLSIALTVLLLRTINFSILAHFWRIMKAALTEHCSLKSLNLKPRNRTRGLTSSMSGDDWPQVDPLFFVPSLQTPKTRDNTYLKST